MGGADWGKGGCVGGACLPGWEGVGEGAAFMTSPLCGAPGKGALMPCIMCWKQKRKIPVR